MRFSGRMLLTVAVIGVIGISAVFSYRVVPSLAVQDPVINLDMVPSDNSYDETSNTMTVGTTENCLTSATANTATHNHTIQAVIQNVEDLVGWQVRLNYLGDQFRPNTVNFAPFTDNNAGQNVSFVNLPLEGGIHRDLSVASLIPPSAAGPQSAAFGSTIIGAPTIPVSPDTPAKSTPDDTSYSAPSGGILASFTAQVVGNQARQPSLLLNVDDGTPNTPGSGVAIFDGSGTQDVLLPVTSLGDGYHGEGATCVPLDCVNNECPGPPVDVTNHTFINSTPLPANGLHVRFSGAVTPRLVQNAPGCNSPTISGDHTSGAVDLTWDSLCVDSGETVIVEITSAPRAEVSCSNWSTLGLRLFGDCDAP